MGSTFTSPYLISTFVVPEEPTLPLTSSQTLQSLLSSSPIASPRIDAPKKPTFVNVRVFVSILEDVRLVCLETEELQYLSHSSPSLILLAFARCPSGPSPNLRFCDYRQEKQEAVSIRQEKEHLQPLERQFARVWLTDTQPAPPDILLHNWDHVLLQLCQRHIAHGFCQT